MAPDRHRDRSVEDDNRTICYTLPMQLNYPLTFDLMGLTRNLIWGGSKLKRLVPDYPTEAPLAEIWLVSDRPEDGRVGMVTNGPLAGVTMTELLAWFPNELLGSVKPMNGKFPLLIKLLDTNDAFSLQVHPNDVAAKKLNAESKTEFWAFLDGTDEGAHATAGIKQGVARDIFDSTLRSGADLTPLLHTIALQPGDALHVPAGRLHSMSKGALIYEVQENSNSTYRVFDWNRIDGKTGQPRALHIDEAIASIDFTDVEPTLQAPKKRQQPGATVEQLVDTPYFTIERWTPTEPAIHRQTSGQSFEVITMVEGEATISGGGQNVHLGQFGTTLLPAALKEYSLKHAGGCVFLRTFVRTENIRRY